MTNRPLKAARTAHVGIGVRHVAGKIFCGFLEKTRELLIGHIDAEAFRHFGRHRGIRIGGEGAGILRIILIRVFKPHAGTLLGLLAQGLRNGIATRARRVGRSPGWGGSRF